MNDYSKEKILVLGNVNSIHLKGFIERVLLPLGFEVEVFCNAHTKQEVASQKAFCKEHGIKCYDKSIFVRESFCRFLKEKLHFRKLSICLKGLMEYAYVVWIKLFHSFDVINVHFVDLWGLKVATRIKKKGEVLVANYWGSDLMRVSDDELKSRWKYLNEFDLASTDSIDLENRFFEVYGHTTKFREKCPRICYGSEIAEHTDDLMATKNRVLKGIEIPESKLVISIGYNAGKPQQHIEIIDALAKLPKEYIENIVLILQMTYLKPLGNYVEEVFEQARKSGFETIQYTDYLTEEDVAKIRVATDIFINGQTTDAFCSTIKEYMYANTTLFNAKWLEYKEIDEWNLKTTVFDNFTEIPDLVKQFNKDKEKENQIHNREIIKDKFTWDGCKAEWEKVYASLLEK